jgi:hypothetical protein
VGITPSAKKLLIWFSTAFASSPTIAQGFKASCFTTLAVVALGLAWVA